MSKIIGIGIIALILIASVGIANANITNFTADVGSSSVRWNWDYNDSTTSVALWLNGVHQFNTTLDMYSVVDANPREEYCLILRNNTNVTASSEILGMSTAKTYYPSFILYILFLFSIVFLLLTIFFRVFVKSVIFGTFGFMLSMSAFYFSFPMNLSVLSYLCIGVAALCFIWIMGKMFAKLIGDGHNEEDDWI